MAEIQLKRWGGGKALRISDKFVLTLHIFLITMEKYGNDKNDFLQTQRIRQLDKKYTFPWLLKKICKIKTNLSEIRKALLPPPPPPPLQLNFRHCVCVAIFIILESQSEKLWHQNYKLRPENYKLRHQNYKLHVQNLQV